jgi:regulator of nucleoside diphosphate kinase
MKRTGENARCVTSLDRCRLGSMLVDSASRAWGSPRDRVALEQALEEASTPRTSADFVRMSSRVRLVDLSTGQERYVTLVYPEDVDLAPDCVSVLEPLGVALVGRQLGDVVNCPDMRSGPRFRVAQLLHGYEPVANFSTTLPARNEQAQAFPVSRGKSSCQFQKSATALDRPHRAKHQPL